VSAPVLAWVEHALPAPDLEGRLALARTHGLALEVANRPDLPNCAGTDLGAIRRSGVPVVSLQAYGMHDTHPLHPDPRVREAGLAHLGDTIGKAAALGVPRVLAVCGYGRETCARPPGSCRDFFAAILPLARSRGVRILIEPLSPLRAAAMTDPGEIERLLDDLASPDVFGLALDTGHALDGGHEVDRWLEAWRHPVDELQLRGPGSAPPPPDVPLARWISRLRAPPAVVCVEHGVAIGREVFAELASRLRGEIERLAGRS